MNNQLSSMSRYLAKKIIERGVFTIGEFQLNSGNISKYFYDFSKFYDSKGLDELGFAFSKTIQEMQIPFDILFGTAYKGIAICLSTAMVWYKDETVLKEKIFLGLMIEKNQRNMVKKDLLSEMMLGIRRF